MQLGLEEGGGLSQEDLVAHCIQLGDMEVTMYSVLTESGLV